MKKKILVLLMVITSLCVSALTGCKAFDNIKGKIEDLKEQVNNSVESGENESEDENESSSIPNLNLNPEHYPDSMVFSLSGEEYDFLKEANLEENGTYAFDIVLKNEVGDVDDFFSNYRIVKIGHQGKFNATKELVNSAGETISTEEVTVDMEELSCYVQKDYPRLTLDLSSFLNVRINDGTLIVNTFASEKSLYLQKQVSDLTVKLTYLSPYYDPRGGGEPVDVRFYVYIEEINSGVTGMLYIDII